MPSSRTQPSYARLALAPGLLAAIVSVATLPLIGSSWYIWVRYALAILALIVCVFVVQGKSYWWLIGLVPAAVVFNPVWPLPLPDAVLYVVQLVAAVLFVAVGVSIKVKVDDDKGRPAGRYDGKGTARSKGR
jgi:hypothetical protein